MKWIALCVLAVSIVSSEARCRYNNNSTDGECDTATGVRSRTFQLNSEDSDEDCPPTRTLSKICNADSGCRYQRRKAGTWTECDPVARTVTVTRALVSGDGCPAQVTEVFSCRGRAARMNKGGQRAGQRKKKGNKNKNNNNNNADRRRRRQKKKGQNQRRPTPAANKN